MKREVSGDSRNATEGVPYNARNATEGVPYSAGNLAEGVPHSAGQNVSLGDLQALIRRMYFEKDEARGIEGTFLWLMEEVGELATALRSGTQQERREEFADVLAWLATIANVAGIDLSQAIAEKYGSGCPGCGQLVCQCAGSEKP